VFEPYYRLIVQNTFSDELGGGAVADEYLGAAFAHERVMKDLLTQPDAVWFDDRRTPQRETRDDILQRSFSEAVSWTQDRLGADPTLWGWGRIHRVTLGHVPFGQVPGLARIFNGPELPARGASFTVDVGEADLVDPFEMSFGVSQRWIVDFADDGRALAINSTGQSGLLFHPQADDDVQKWLNGEYEPLSIRDDDVRATSAAVLTLAPVRGPQK
jgi:penicillin amidase